jgi:hypothetical protein
VARDQQLGLSVLLSGLVIRHTAELDAATSPRHPAVPLPTWINVMQHVGPEAVPQNVLPARGRISRRAVAFRLGALERHGLVALGPNPSGARGKVVTLTAEGRKVLESHRPPFDDVERRWRKRVGAKKLDALRSALEAVVGRFELELPHHPECYGPVDARIMGGPGQDWKPVPRGDGDTVSSLPLCALLSQALCAYAIDYETTSGALMFGSNVFRLIGDGDEAIADLFERSRAPTVLGGLDRHGFVKIDKERERIRLTSLGKLIRDTYADTLDAIEQRWEERYDADDVRALRTALEAFAAPDDDALPHFFNFHALWLGGPTHDT